MTPFFSSDYRKHHNPYFCTSPNVVLVIVPLKTPTGKWSKYYGTLKLSDSRTDKQERLDKFMTEYLPKVFKKELKKGYTISEPLLYNGIW